MMMRFNGSRYSNRHGKYFKVKEVATCCTEGLHRMREGSCSKGLGLGH